MIFDKLGEDNRCLANVQAALGKRKTHEVTIESLHGKTTRKVFMVNVKPGNQYWADAVTGTLYDVITGVSLSHSQRRIVNCQSISEEVL